MTQANNQVERAGTVELNASVEGVEMYAYMVPGCCGLRSFFGLNKGTPEQVIIGIVTSGISGCMMILTDAYSNGKHAQAFADFVHENNLGACTISQGVTNQYTGKRIFGVVFEYSPQTLIRWLDAKWKAEGKGGWKRPDGWTTSTDSVWMDSVYYQYGGRPKPKSRVDKGSIERIPTLQAPIPAAKAG